MQTGHLTSALADTWLYWDIICEVPVTRRRTLPLLLYALLLPVSPKRVPAPSSCSIMSVTAEQLTIKLKTALEAESVVRSA